jgi:hypothetical protein
MKFVGVLCKKVIEGGILLKISTVQQSFSFLTKYMFIISVPFLVLHTLQNKNERIFFKCNT